MARSSVAWGEEEPSMTDQHDRKGARVRPEVVRAGSGLFLAAMLLWGLLDATRAAPAPSVDIRDSQYLPVTLTVPVGTAVRWINRDEETHTIASDTGLFGSAGLELGEAYTYTFMAPGRYPYTCDLHPFMRGTVVVQ
jgi:plastocyanin